MLVRRSLPVDIRHNSKIDRVAVGEWASELLSGKALPVKVLITGASGMTGRAVALALIDRGDDVTVLQRRTVRARHRRGAGRRRRPPSWSARAATGQDAVLHLAAKVDVVGPWADYQRANVDGHQVGGRRPAGRPASAG